MKQTSLWVFAAALSLLVQGCGLSPRTLDAGGGAGCTPDDTKTCPCIGGGNGVQTCNGDGSGWSSCDDCPISVFDGGSKDSGEIADGGHDGGVGGPKICPTSTNLDFGSFLVAQSVHRTVVFRSCGTDPLTLSEVALVNSSRGWFTLDGVQPDVPITLAPGEELTVTVSCTPDMPATETGQLIISANDPSLADGRWHVNLLCRGLEPPSCKIKADPSTVDYGHLAANKTATKEVFLLNVGDKTCTVTEIHGPTDTVHYKITGIAEEDGTAIAGAPFDISATRRVKVSVQHTGPSGNSCPSDKITFVNSSTNAPILDVTLRGSCGDYPICKFKVTPVGTINFGNVSRGAKKTMSVFFENVGTDDCQITSSAFGPMTGDWYSFAESYSFPIIVPPNETGKIGIVCSPKGTGPATTKMGIPDLMGQNVVNTSTSDPAQPPAGTTCTSPGWCHKLLCTGGGTILNVLPDPVEFGLVTIGCNSRVVPVKLYNNGTGAMNVSKIEVMPVTNPAVFIIASSPPTPFAVGANSSVEIKMKYNPSKADIEEGVLRIWTDAPNASNGFIDARMIGSGTTERDIKDVFVQTDKPAVDVLFCIDNSASMSDKQAAMAASFPAFIGNMTSLNIDYQIGVVTSEINQSEKGDTGDMIYPGVLFQRAGYPRILTNTSPHPTTSPYQPVAADVITAFQANAMPGTCCSEEQEACMEAVRQALSNPLINDDQANKGFLRKYAKLAVVMLSDEDDQSPGSVDYYVDFIRGLKGTQNKDLLSVSMIAAFDRDGDVSDPPDAQACVGSSQPDSAGVRYLDMFKKIGNGQAISICQSDWSQAMQRLGLDTFVAVIEYFLSRQADPSTIVVTVNGIAAPDDPVNGYRYDPVMNSIVFGAGAIPPRGADVNAAYMAQCY